MKISKTENGWSIELDDGTTVTMSMNEVGILAERYRRETLWDEVALRFDADPVWPDIEEAKDDILDTMEEQLYSCDTELSDAVYWAVERWVDLDGVDEEEQA